MVEQETQPGQYYCASQHTMESISSMCRVTEDDNNLSTVSNPHDSSNIQVALRSSSKAEELHSYFTNFDASTTVKNFDSIDGFSADFPDASDLNADMSLVNYEHSSGSPISWSSFMEAPTIKLDDVFQVNKADLLHGPTLAELNANDESLFDSFDSFESFLPSESKSSSFQFQPLNAFGLTTEFNSSEELKAKTELSKSNIFPKLAVDLPSKPDYRMLTSSHASFPTTFETMDINKMEDFSKYIKSESSSNASFQHASQISLNESSTPKNLSSKSQQMENNDESSSSSDYDKNRFHGTSISNDEIDSQKDDTDNDIFSSDEDSDFSKSVPRKKSCVSNSSGKKSTKYFWQYNIKTKKSSADQSMPSSSHLQSPKNPSGTAMKVRRGDGNDLTPNPQKLYNIGVELNKLNSIIDNLTPVNKLPDSARPKSRKEKNKLASRACRLKKKAYHEANKLKNFGLQQEYDSLSFIINESKKILASKILNLQSDASCEKKIMALEAVKDAQPVAGCTAKFVNDVLHEVEAGNPTGLLNTL